MIYSISVARILITFPGYLFPVFTEKYMKYPIPEHIIKAMILMKDYGLSPYLVGGCVRDHIMGRMPNDYDITVDASSQEIIEAFGKKGYETNLKGKQFGTVAICLPEGEIEITPHRTEGSYSDSRHPDSVCFVKDIRLDLVRRDFTVNALAMDCEYNIIDEFGGLEDIDKGIIKCVGDPYVRFGEDALRILRAIRFASRFGFEIEPETRRAMSSNKHSLKNISGERVRLELFGVFEAPYAHRLLCECKDVISEIICNFKADEFLLQACSDPIIKLFSCVYQNSFEDVCLICGKLKLRSEEANKIQTMHKLYCDILSRDGRKVLFDDIAKTALCEYKTEYVYSVFLFSGSANAILDDFIQNGIYETSKLCVSGGDIASGGLFPKNETSKILKRVLIAVACDKIRNTKEDIQAFLEDIRKNEFE